MRKILKVLLVPVILVGLGLAALGATDIIEIYSELFEAPTNVPASPISSPESTALATPVRPRLTRKASRVIVAPTSSVANATACIEVVLYQRKPDAPSTATTTYATVALVQTVTFGSTGETGSNAGRFPAYDGWLSAVTLGCEVYDVRCLYVSSGNVTWSSWTLGLSTVKAGASAE